MKIEILGAGCSQCRKVAENAQQAIREIGIEADIVKVEKLNEIARYGVVMTPALVVNGEVKISGRVPSVEEVRSLFV